MRPDDFRSARHKKYFSGHYLLLISLDIFRLWRRLFILPYDPFVSIAPTLSTTSSKAAHIEHERHFGRLYKHKRRMRQIENDWRYENDRFGRIRIVLDNTMQPHPAQERISWRSRLAPLPPGAAVARSPHPASGGGGGGERNPLVGPSERRLGTLCAVVVRKGSGR
jgi:hypothetical protein